MLPDLHPAQQIIAQDTTRFKVVAAGRRFGKTRLAALMCVQAALNGGRAWWVAPSFPLANIGWREIKRLCKQIPGAKPLLADRIYYLPGGGFVQAKSALTEAGLRGEGLDFCVVDECAFMAEERWQEELRPALSDREGGAMFISTPKGRNWFWKHYQLGIREDVDDWASFTFKSSDNPFFPKAEMEAARLNVPDRVFRQEYLAEFIDDAGSVFRNVDECTTAELLTEAEPNRVYVGGIDWGRDSDSTVVTVMDVEAGAMVYMDRFTGESWDQQTARVWGAAERFNPQGWIVEKNSFGGPQIERLQGEGLPITPWVASNATKAAVINQLTLAFETRSIGIIDDRILNHELKSYTFSTTASGLTRYHAPSGQQDDTVISLALAWHARMGAVVPSASTYGMGHRTRGTPVSKRPGPIMAGTGATPSRYNNSRPRPGERFRGKIRRRMF